MTNSFIFQSVSQYEIVANWNFSDQIMEVIWKV